jgi:hypothetical protein
MERVVTLEKLAIEFASRYPQIENSRQYHDFVKNMMRQAKVKNFEGNHVFDSIHWWVAFQIEPLVWELGTLKRRLDLLELEKFLDID